MTSFKTLVTLSKTFRVAAAALLLTIPLAGQQAHAQSPCTLTNTISINTGYNQGYSSPISIGGTDGNWTFSNASPALQTAASVSASGPLFRINALGSWASSGTASWLSCSSSNVFATTSNADVNRYSMEIERTFRTCVSDNITIQFHVYADNYVNALWIDNVLQSFTQPSTTVTSNYGSGTTYTATFPMSPGNHSIRMRVGNYPVAATLNYFGIMVEGDVTGTTNSIVDVDNSGECSCQAPCGTLNKLNICTDPINAPFNYTFDIGLSPASTQFAFDFGDGSPMSFGTGSMTLMHTYPGPISPTVRVEIYDATGSVCDTRKVNICMSPDGARPAASPDPAAGPKKAATENLAPYPNPTRTSLFVPVKGMKGEVSASILAQDGRVLMRKKALVHDEAKWEFNTADLPPGVYVISVTDARGTKASTFQKL